jgi:hypothetical protein
MRHIPKLTIVLATALAMAGLGIIAAGPVPAGATAPTAPVVGMASLPTGHGYWEVASNGAVTAFGNAKSLGDMATTPLDAPIVGMAAPSTGAGYWLVASDGGIFAYGTAKFDGSMGGHPLNKPIVGIASTPTGHGYWEVAADGGIFAFGRAQFYGSMGARSLNKPIVGIAGTPTGAGYWEVASDGGIFAFGTAQFYGSMGGRPLNEPVVGLAPGANGAGYWEVASDGGLFAFGDAGFYGSMGGRPLNAPVVGMTAPAAGDGYWEVAADGGVFAFGAASFAGSAAGTTAPTSVITKYAYIDPSFVQTPTNPLVVTYAFSAAATADTDGVQVATPLPVGILNFYSDGVLECAVNVGTAVSGGTCRVGYSAFGTHTVVTEYITGATTTVSQTAVESIQPFATTTTVAVTGGGSAGITMTAQVLGPQGQEVRTETGSLAGGCAACVRFTITDQTRGWSASAVGVFPRETANGEFTCILSGNYPKVGEFVGCTLFSGPIYLYTASSPLCTPSVSCIGAGDEVEVSATFLGTVSFEPSGSSVEYTIPTGVLSGV